MSGKKTVYVSGGITGIENPRDRFDAAAAYVVADGNTPLSPYSIDPCPDQTCVETPSNPRSNGHTWNCWLRYDLIGMLQCDEVLTLPGWQTSKGAVLEVTTALNVGIPVRHLSERALS